MGAGCGCRMGFSPPLPPFSLPPVSPSISPFPSGVAVLADRDIRICLIIKTPNRLTACLAESESSKIPESSFPRRRESRAVGAETYPEVQKNRNPTAVIPAKAGIQRRNTAGIYRKKTGTGRIGFPPARE
ncbi:hypothetical protein NEILACOT_04185 [Neisseria lactamica ATCC 23970]|uniref:Uncharacterized protein n=1 Tax=Neisseria lactamica ATCC 23970 TaxID=546265 RepID=D0W9H3_NEILA|nr:hypothetical protein NEILACOT_04185 [Neisseria lactamica ATCC 23970]